MKKYPIVQIERKIILMTDSGGKVKSRSPVCCNSRGSSDRMQIVKHERIALAISRIEDCGFHAGSRNATSL